MPNVASVLKEEISRLSRKEIRSANASLVKSNATLRSWVADMKKEIAGLRAEQKQLSRALSKLATRAGVEAPQDEFRMTSRNVRALRRRLGLTQAEFAKLVGVSAQSVFIWENKGGRLQFRRATEAALKDVQELSPADARQRMTAKRSRRKGKKRRRSRK